MMLVPAFVEDAGTKGTLVDFAAGTVLVLWECKVG